jgi:hypothetical protein
LTRVPRLLTSIQRAVLCRLTPHLLINCSPSCVSRFLIFLFDGRTFFFHPIRPNTTFNLYHLLVTICSHLKDTVPPPVLHLLLFIFVTPFVIQFVRGFYQFPSHTTVIVSSLPQFQSSTNLRVISSFVTISWRLLF